MGYCNFFTISTKLKWIVLIPKSGRLSWLENISLAKQSHTNQFSSRKPDVWTGSIRIPPEPIAISLEVCLWFTSSQFDSIFISALMNFYDPETLVWKWTSSLGGIASRVVGWPGLEHGRSPVKAVSNGGGAKAVLERPVLQCAPLSPGFQFHVLQPGPCSKSLQLVALVSPTVFPWRSGLSGSCCFCDQEISLSPWSRRLPLSAI